VGTLVIAGMALSCAMRAEAGGIQRDLVRAVFPAADAAGPVTGTPPAARAMADGSPVGWVFLTDEVVGSVGYSGKPISIAVGLDEGGRVTGARLVAHQEPILVIGVTDTRLQAFLDQVAGLDVRSGATLAATADGGSPVERVSGATYSSALILDAVLNAARAVARSRGLLGDDKGGGARLDRDSFAPVGWDELMADGSIVTRVIANAEADAALGPDALAPDAAPEAAFVTLWSALATPARIGRNVLGDALYAKTIGGLGPDDSAILVLAEGRYSFKGTAWRQSGVFDRIQVAQGTRTFRLGADQHVRIEGLAVQGAPEAREIGLFFLPGAAGFDPLEPWRLELLIERSDGEGRTHLATFTLDYHVPANLVLGAAPTVVVERDEALWIAMWRSRPVRIGVLVLALGALTTVLVLQDGLARRRRLYRIVRLGFLGFTLAWLGWYAGPQLSVVNILAFAQALMTGFRWDVFLIDPLMFILWSYVAVALLFWGRGVFCGWLCPFGALQELLNEAARALKVRQIAIPFGLHERLWPIKYIVFLGLFAVSLGSFDMALAGAEVEPFKTAITLRFARAWPFLLYVGLVLVAGLFVERAYCRYLCPLGGALAIPARLRMFDWLKRKRQCGAECNICAVRCTVQAIHPDGRINPNECIHCLNCQVFYYDDRTCPPLIERRKRRETRAALRAGRRPATAAPP
jgi:transcriptional regulator of nitric oxide reductase